MIFLTVGTYPLQFDRLIEAVDLAVRDGLVSDEIFAQTGACKYIPEHMEYANMLEKNEFDDRFKDAKSVLTSSSQPAPCLWHWYVYPRSFLGRKLSGLTASPM